MRLHINLVRSSSDCFYIWINHIVGFSHTEKRIPVKDMPDKATAVLIAFGHAARMIEHSGQTSDNIIFIQDDRDMSVGHAEQFELFEMLSERRKKLLDAMNAGGRYGQTYALYMRTIMAMIHNWKIRVSLMSAHDRCENCRTELEVYKSRCALCGTPHKIQWQGEKDYVVGYK